MERMWSHFSTTHSHFCQLTSFFGSLWHLWLHDGGPCDNYVLWKVMFVPSSPNLDLIPSLCYCNKSQPGLPQAACPSHCSKNTVLIVSHPCSKSLNSSSLPSIKFSLLSLTNKAFACLTPILHFPKLPYWLQVPHAVLIPTSLVCSPASNNSCSFFGVHVPCHLFPDPPRSVPIPTDPSRLRCPAPFVHASILVPKSLIRHSFVDHRPHLATPCWVMG